MTSNEYTQWLKGFLDAVDGYNITKRQFDSIREKLKEVQDEPIGLPNGLGVFGNPAIVPQLGGGWVTTNGGRSGTTTTTQYPKGANVTYTDSNGNTNSYTIPNTINNIFTNKNSEDDEKLLMD